MQRVRVGDLVYVTTGKEKKKRGQVTKILKPGNHVLIQGLKMVKRHSKPTQANTKGQIVEKESAIHLSKVMPIDVKRDVPTRVKVKIEEGKKRFLSAKGYQLAESSKSKEGVKR